MRHPRYRLGVQLHPRLGLRMSCRKERQLLGLEETEETMNPRDIQMTLNFSKYTPTGRRPSEKRTREHLFLVFIPFDDCKCWKQSFYIFENVCRITLRNIALSLHFHRIISKRRSLSICPSFLIWVRKQYKAEDLNVGSFMCFFNGLSMSGVKYLKVEHWTIVGITS